MSDLLKQVANYWKDYNNCNINQALINFEKIEGHRFSISESDEKKILKILNFLKNQKEIKTNSEDMLRLMEALPAAYMFYLLHQINIKHPDYALNLIKDSNKYKDSKIVYKNFYERNMLFEKLQVLSRVFSSDRMNKLIQALSE